MTTDTTWIGSTRSEVDGWVVVTHWHAVDGKIIPAGVDVRCYDAGGDEHWTGTEGNPDPRHYEGGFRRGQPPQAVTSGLLGKRLRWGQLLTEQRSELADSLHDTGDDSRFDPDVAEEWKMLAERAGAPMSSGLRATDVTYRRVASLLPEAERDYRGRVALGVLELLREKHDYPLNPDNKSDRVKVRQWMRKARDLPKTTANTERKER